MQRFLSIIWFCCIAACLMAETVFEFNSAGSVQQTKDGFSVSLSKGGNTQMSPEYKAATQYYEEEMRLYAENTITVSGGTITNVQIVCAKSASGKAYAELTAASGEITSGGASADAKDLKVDAWTGNASKVVFTLGSKGQRKLVKLIINGAAVVIDPEEPEPLPTEADLDKSYTYTEPVVVNAPDTQIFKNEFAFISNNILVHCSKGSILRENTTKGEEYPAYFNCNENEQITFSATQPMKRLVVDGFLRKAFTATCDKGTMTHKASEDYDVESDNVLSISNIDATSVTIHCAKQLRCFEVRIYFKEAKEGIQNTEYRRQTQKVLRDGQLYLMYQGMMYNVQGVRF